MSGALAGAPGGEPVGTGFGALIARCRAEILAGILAAEPVGTPDPDETPEYMAEVLLEHEAQEAFGPQRRIPHEEVMRELLAPTYRWQAYLEGGRPLPDDEARRLDDAEKMVHEHFGISPAHYAYSHDAAERGVKLANVIAYLVLQRELWEPDLAEHPRLS